MRRLNHEIRLFLIALQFLTRVPIPARVGFEPDWLRASARYFSLVGACVGVVCAAVLWAASFLWPMPVAVLLCMLSSVVLTGAFHEDGLADTSDALGGMVSRERALIIMKDSRIGTYGTVALLLTLMLKMSILNTMPIGLAIPCLVLAHALSRAGAVVLMRYLPYAGDISQLKTKPMAHQISTTSMCIASLWVGLLAGVLVGQGWLGGQGLCAMMIASLISLVWCARCWQHRLGGITGDTLGATQQLTELCVLLAAAAVGS
jgi:adenosylcobinamide-GDP ribazoletransferase